MSRINNVLICLLLLAIVLLFLSLPYFSPPEYVEECNMIEGADRESCIASVACITHDQRLCNDLEYRDSCITYVAETKEISKWVLEEDKDYYSTYSYSEIDDPVLRCAVDGLQSEMTTYSNEYLHYYAFSSIFYFSGDCKKYLEDANLSICQQVYDEGLDDYFYSICVKNIHFAKNSSLEETCQGDDICMGEYARYHSDPSACGEDDSCYTNFAIRSNRPELCDGLSGYSERDCFSYFAIKEVDIDYCDKIQNEDHLHYCRAIILAMQTPTS